MDDIENKRIFKGGIQPGTSALDKDSKRLDSLLKNCAKILTSSLILRDLKYVFKRKLNKEYLSSINVWTGCEPDGGIWYKDDIPIVAFEAKKQNRGGNAIERWSKNFDILKSINPKIKYITFGIGEGFNEKYYPYLYAKTQLHLNGNKEFNTLYDKGPSWFINVKGFEMKYVLEIMANSIIGIGGKDETKET